MPTNNIEYINYLGLLKTLVLSVISAICAYLIVFLYSNYVSLYFAYDFDVPAIVNYKGIVFLSESAIETWSRDEIITILLSKPISAMIFGLGFLIILMVGNRKPASLILFLLWLNIFSFNTSYGVLIDDLIAQSGTYEAAIQMNIDNIILIVLSILFGFILYKIGMMNGRLVIMSFPNQNLCSFKNRIQFFVLIFLVPLLAVVGYCYLFGSASSSLSELFKNLPVLLILMPFLTSGKIANKKFKYLPSSGNTKIDIYLSIAFVMVSLALIFVLYHGISLNKL